MPLHRGAARRRCRGSSTPTATGCARSRAARRTWSARRRAAGSTPRCAAPRRCADEPPRALTADRAPLRVLAPRGATPPTTPGRGDAQRRGGGPMAGSGTAPLRDADDVLLRVEHLVVEHPGAGRRKRARRVATSASTSSPGETLGLVGESGCGKSTTGRARSCSCTPPTSGSVRLDGARARRLRTRRAAQRPRPRSR